MALDIVGICPKITLLHIPVSAYTIVCNERMDDALMSMVSFGSIYTQHTNVVSPFSAFDSCTEYEECLRRGANESSEHISEETKSQLKIEGTRRSQGRGRLIDVDWSRFVPSPENPRASIDCSAETGRV